MARKARKVIHAAGGVVVRGGARRRFAVVQRSKDDSWVLPRGKLKRNETPLAGARREATEETGFRVRVGPFLGAITYRASGRPKVVQFWHMDAAAEPSREVSKDIAAIKWLPLPKAVRKLTYPLERLFLDSVGHRAASPPARPVRRKAAKSKRRASPKPRSKAKR